jgi:uncharacterized membrane protein YraQ (UPF0718 family)
LNPAVLAFIVLTLGWGWAVLRLVVGAALVLTAAWAAVRLTSNGGTVASSQDGTPAATMVPEATTASGHWTVKWLRSVGRLALWLTPEYLVMVALLGAARAFLFPAGLHLDASAWTLMILAAAGTLFVIPTSGEVPIVQTMLAAGVGAAPAGVLLLTLAPLSLPSLLMLARVIPGRVLAAAAVLTVAAGVAAGAAARLFGL